MESIKKRFNIDSLLDIFQFIEQKDNSRCGEDSTWLDDIIEYADMLKNTKVTPDIFIGYLVQLAGFERRPQSAHFRDDENIYRGQNLTVLFKKYGKIEAYTTTNDGITIKDSGFVGTLDDLSRLTKGQLKLKQ